MTISFFVLTGRTNCVQFLQTPSILVPEKSSIAITCTHDDSGLYNMYWYQQKSFSIMALIGYTIGASGDPKYEEGFEKRFTQSREGTLKGNLTILNLHQSDSAVYFCAASKHNAAHLNNSLTKTHTHTLKVYYLMRFYILASGI